MKREEKEPLKVRFNVYVQRLCVDNTAAEALIGWEPQYALNQGLKETIEWIKNHLELFKTICDMKIILSNYR